MNKIEELAYINAVAADNRVCNQHSFNAGRKSVLDELAKQSEPVAWAKIFRGRTDLVLGCAMQAEDAVDLGWVPLFAAPLPQADLVAEVESLRSDVAIRDEYVDELRNDCKTLRQQLSAAQADNDELVKVLEELSCLGNGNSYGNSHGNVIAQKAIAAHKARQAKCDPTLTQCPRCNNDISKCDGAFKARQGKEES